MTMRRERKAAGAHGPLTVKLAAVIVSAGFIVWGLVGKSEAAANRFGAPAA